MDVNEGKFNFGIDTLQRISQTLQRIKLICELPPTIHRQRLHIDAIKNYYADASVLMSLQDASAKFIPQYSTEIDNLKITSRIVKGKKIEGYDPNLERRLQQIKREIAIILNKYYMPVKEYDEDDY